LRDAIGNARRKRTSGLREVLKEENVMSTLMVLWLLLIVAVVMPVLLPPVAGEVRRIGPRETGRRIGAGTWRLVRYWGLGLPRRFAELLLPPHIVCPPVFEHLSLKEWRANAKDFVGDDDGLGWCGREGKTVFEWLEARNLPPVPRDEYCPEKRRWVDDMERDERETMQNTISCSSVSTL
jgi:hypothetical protein